MFKVSDVIDIVLVFLLLTYFLPVSIVDFKQVKVIWEIITCSK